MTLLAPWALWLLALGGAVIALYLLKIKRRAATVPALDFWLQLAGRTKVHSLWDRLKRLLSMLLWLVVVACLALAVGNPLLSLGSIKPRAIAVVIDNSASMQTLESQDSTLASGQGSGGTTRLDLARRAVEDLTTRRPVTDEFLLIEAAQEPHVREPWTYEGKAIRTAAEGMTPFSGKRRSPRGHRTRRPAAGRQTRSMHRRHYRWGRGDARANRRDGLAHRAVDRREVERQPGHRAPGGPRIASAGELPGPRHHRELVGGEDRHAARA
jgi:hypothetical protein